MVTFVGHGDYWRLLRRLWQPAFSPASLRGYVPLMDSVLSKFTASLDAKLAAAESAGQRLSMDIWRVRVVGSTAYGVDFRVLDNTENGETEESLKEMPALTVDSASSLKGSMKNRIESGQVKGDQEELASYHQGGELVEACKMLFQFTSISAGSVYVRMLAMFPEMNWLIKMLSRNFPDETLKMQKAVSDDLIKRWRADHAEVAEGKAPPPSNPMEEGKEGKEDKAPLGSNPLEEGKEGKAPLGSNPMAAGSFLDHLLSNPQSSQLSAIQLSAQAMTFTLAVERKLIEEVDSWLDSLPNKGVQGSGDVNPETLSQLKYVEAVFHEALRLHPPAPGTSRISEEDLVVGPYTLPKGTPMLLSMHVVHRSEAWGEDFESFRPERFIERAELASRDNHSYIPFGVGSRYCIGWRFAVQEAKMALVRMYRQYTFELDPGQERLQVKYGMTQSPKNGV
eukprot:gene29083-32294_t